MNQGHNKCLDVATHRIVLDPTHDTVPFRNLLDEVAEPYSLHGPRDDKLERVITHRRRRKRCLRVHKEIDAVVHAKEFEVLSIQYQLGGVDALSAGRLDGIKSMTSSIAAISVPCLRASPSHRVSV